jgi:hypothetical protein
VSGLDELTAESGPSLDMWADLSVSIRGLAAELTAQRDRADRKIKAIHPFKVTLPSIITNTTLDLPDVMGPHDGYAWDVHLVTLNSAFTGGTVILFSGAGGTQEFVFSQAGMLQYGKGQLVLMPHDRLTLVTAGLAGSAQVTLRGIEIETWLLADYLT